MALNYLTDIQPLEGNGVTDADIAASLNADPRHKRDVNATGGDIASNELDLLHVLSARFKVLRIGSDAAWKGSLVAHFDGIDDSDPVKQGFELLLSQLQVNDRKVFCHSDKETGQLTTLLTEVAKTLVVSPYTPEKVQEDMDALTGGKLFSGVTESDVTTCRSEYQTEQEAIVAQQATVAKMGALNDAHDAAVQAFNANGSLAASDVIAAYSTSLNANWGV